MIKYIRKTVFNSGCDAIVNTVNCLGVMGAGLALEFGLRYPNMLEKYKKECENKEVVIGKLNLYREDDVTIIGFPTKTNWKYPSKIEYIESGLDYLIEHYKEFGVKSIAIPPLGCSNGGLDFISEVKPLIERKLSNLDIEIVICIDSGVPEGKEKEMLDKFKSSNINDLCDDLRINGKAREILSKKQFSVKRFADLQKLDGVGSQTYKKLFNEFYKEKQKKYVQQTLF